MHTVVKPEKMKSLLLSCASILFVYSLCASQQVVKGTVIIIHRCDGSVYVGADSKSSGIDNVPLPGAFCKIIVRQGVVFFCSGCSSVSPIYNAMEIANSVVDKSKTIGQIAVEFRDSIFARTSALDSIKQTQSELFAKAFVDSTLFNLGILKQEGDSICFCSMKFAFARNQRVELESNIEIGNNIPAPTEFWGKIDALLQAFQTAHANLLWRQKTPEGIAGEIEELIKLQCGSTPQAVGEPIYVVQISPTVGVRWLINHQPCSDGF
jgi:hypothetical protein